MTTVSLATPNFELDNISSNSFLASSILLSIKTPLPAANPSAFKTNGGFKVSKNNLPSFKDSFVKL